MGGCGNAGPALTPVEGGCEPGGPIKRLLLYITGTCECDTEEQNSKGGLISESFSISKKMTKSLPYPPKENVLRQ
jgi:hypothetical protein